jgi:hypothetical protein
MNQPSDRFADWDSAYVLGMLAPEDRREYERHLATCPSCSAAVADIAGLPGILSLLTRDEAVALTVVVPGESMAADQGRLRPHDPDLVRRLAASVGRRRRAARTRGAAIALASAAVLGLGGIAVGSTLAQQSRPAVSAPTAAHTAAPLAPEFRAMTVVAPGVMTADLAVTEKGWGTRFDWRCQYLSTDWTQGPPTYDLVITDNSGAQTTVATWTATKSTAAGLVGSTGVATADIRSIEIRAGGATLVREDL